jgi:hypothetical protein
MAKKNNKRPNMQKRQTPKFAKATEAFIEQNISLLAALAWRGYELDGRGFVMVTLQIGQDLEASYVAKTGGLWSILQPDFPEIEAIIQEYDPKTQIALVMRVPDAVNLAIVTPDMPPPIAFVQHATELP